MAAELVAYQYSEISAKQPREQFPSFAQATMLEQETLSTLNALYTAASDDAEALLEELETNPRYLDALFSLAQRTTVPADLRAQAAKCFAHQSPHSQDMMVFAKHPDPLIREAVLAALDELGFTHTIRELFGNDPDSTIRSLARKVR